MIMSGAPFRKRPAVQFMPDPIQPPPSSDPEFVTHLTEHQEILHAFVISLLPGSSEVDDILQRITASRDVVAERLPEQVEFVVTDPILSQKQMDEVSDPVVAEQKAPEHSA